MCARRIIFILAILSVLGHTHFIPKQRPVLPEKSENDNIEGKMEEYGRVVMKRDAEFLAAPTVPPEEGMPGWVIGMIAFCVVVSVAAIIGTAVWCIKKQDKEIKEKEEKEEKEEAAKKAAKKEKEKKKKEAEEEKEKKEKVPDEVAAEVPTTPNPPSDGIVEPPDIPPATQEELNEEVGYQAMYANRKMNFLEWQKFAHLTARQTTRTLAIEPVFRKDNDLYKRNEQEMEIAMRKYVEKINEFMRNEKSRNVFKMEDCGMNPIWYMKCTMMITEQCGIWLDREHELHSRYEDLHKQMFLSFDSFCHSFDELPQIYRWLRKKGVRECEVLPRGLSQYMRNKSILVRYAALRLQMGHIFDFISCDVNEPIIFLAPLGFLFLCAMKINMPSKDRWMLYQLLKVRAASIFSSSETAPVDCFKYPYPMTNLAYTIFVQGPLALEESMKRDAIATIDGVYYKFLNYKEGWKGWREAWHRVVDQCQALNRKLDQQAKIMIDSEPKKQVYHPPKNDPKNVLLDRNMNKVGDKVEDKKEEEKKKEEEEKKKKEEEEKKKKEEEEKKKKDAKDKKEPETSKKQVSGTQDVSQKQDVSNVSKKDASKKQDVSKKQDTSRRQDTSRKQEVSKRQDTSRVSRKESARKDISGTQDVTNERDESKKQDDDDDKTHNMKTDPFKKQDVSVSKKKDMSVSKKKDLDVSKNKTSKSPSKKKAKTKGSDANINVGGNVSAEQTGKPGQSSKVDDFNPLNRAQYESKKETRQQESKKEAGSEAQNADDADIKVKGVD